MQTLASVTWQHLVAFTSSTAFSVVFLTQLVTKFPRLTRLACLTPENEGAPEISQQILARAPELLSLALQAQEADPHVVVLPAYEQVAADQYDAKVLECMQLNQCSDDVLQTLRCPELSMLSLHGALCFLQHLGNYVPQCFPALEAVQLHSLALLDPDSTIAAIKSLPLLMTFVIEAHPDRMDCCDTAFVQKLAQLKHTQLIEVGLTPEEGCDRDTVVAAHAIIELVRNTPKLQHVMLSQATIADTPAQTTVCAALAGEGRARLSIRAAFGQQQWIGRWRTPFYEYSRELFESHLRILQDTAEEERGGERLALKPACATSDDHDGGD